MWHCRHYTTNKYTVHILTYSFCLSSLLPFLLQVKSGPPRRTFSDEWNSGQMPFLFPNQQCQITKAINTVCNYSLKY